MRVEDLRLCMKSPQRSGEIGGKRPGWECGGGEIGSKA